MIKTSTLLLAAAGSLGLANAQAQVQDLDTTPFLGDVILVAFTFCPTNYLPADGRLMQISTHTPLFAMMGTDYGGDGRRTFGLPDLQGRIPVHIGTGEGLNPVTLGSKFGQWTATLNPSDLPQHNHRVAVDSDGPSNTVSPAGNSLTTITFTGGTAYGAIDGSNRTQFNERSVGMTGGSDPITVTSPGQGLLYCVAVTGNFPSR